MKRRQALIPLFWLISAQAFGQTLEVGQTVIVVQAADLETLNGSPANVFPGLPLEILRIEVVNSGPDSATSSRLLVSNGKPGWLDSQFVRLPAEALQYFDERIAGEPQDLGWKTAHAMTLAATGKHKLAIDAFSALLESNPDNLQCLNERTGSYIALGDYKRASADFDAMIAKQPQAFLYNNRALCRRALKDTDGARRDFQKVIELDPDFASAYLSLGRLEAATEHADQALKHYDQYVERFPDMVDGHVSRAELLMSQNDLAGTLESFEAAVRIRPDDIELQRMRGLTLAKLGKTEQAIEAFTSMTEQFPDNPVGWVNRAILYEDNQQPQRAFEDFDRVLQLTPDNAFCLYHRGCVQIALQNYEMAVADLSSAIELEPKTMAFVRRGEAYAQLNQNQSALQDLNRALDNDPQQHFARYLRATIHQLDEEYEKALADYSSLIDNGVRTSVVFYDRSQIYKRQKQWKLVIADLEQSAELEADSHRPVNDLAWVLATVPDESLREPKRAIGLANRACELTQWKSGLVMDTLATAHAAAGDFEKAVALEERAIQQDDGKDVDELRSRLKLFKANKAFVNN